MTERPILFSAEMVRAILDGRKTQTRRAMKAQPTGHHWEMLPGYQLKHTEAVMANGKVAVKFRHTIPQNPSPDFNNAWIPCHYGAPGDTLWVRETWRVHKSYDVLNAARVYGAMGGDVAYCVDYLATHRNKDFWGRGRPSIHMPRWASRITLRITDVRVQRLQDISEDDARAEGASRTDWEYDDGECCDNDREAFSHLWNRINGPSAWDDNPWVWVIEFERVQP